jgi:hypothetical protein
MCSSVSHERVFSLGPFDESGLWFPVARGWSNPTTNGYTRLKGPRKRIPIVEHPQTGTLPPFRLCSSERLSAQRTRYGERTGAPHSVSLQA